MASFAEMRPAPAPEVSFLPPEFIQDIRAQLNIEPWVLPPVVEAIETISDKSGSDQGWMRDTIQEVLFFYQNVVLKHNVISGKDKAYFANAFYGTAKNVRFFHSSRALFFVIDHLGSRVIATFSARQRLTDKLIAKLLKVAVNYEDAFQELTGFSSDEDPLEFLDEFTHHDNVEGISESHSRDHMNAVMTAVTAFLRARDSEGATAYIRAMVNEIRANVLTALYYSWVRDPGCLTANHLVEAMKLVVDPDAAVALQARKLYALAMKRGLDVAATVTNALVEDIATRLTSQTLTGPLWASAHAAFAVTLQNGHSVDAILDAAVGIMLENSTEDRDRFAAATIVVAHALDTRCHALSRYALCAIMTVAERPDASEAVRRVVTQALVLEANKVGVLPSMVRAYLQDVLETYALQYQWPSGLVHALKITLKVLTPPAPYPTPSPHGYPPYPTPHGNPYGYPPTQPYLYPPASGHPAAAGYPTISSDQLPVSPLAYDYSAPVGLGSAGSPQGLGATAASPTKDAEQSPEDANTKSQDS